LGIKITFLKLISSRKCTNIKNILELLSIVTLVLILYSTNIFAELHKCINKDGEAVYSNTICPEGYNKQDINFSKQSMPQIQSNPDEVVIEEQLIDDQNKEDNNSYQKGLNIEIIQEKIVLHPLEISRIKEGVQFVYNYFTNVFEINLNSEIKLKIFGVYKDFMIYQFKLYGKTYTDHGVYSNITNEALVNGSKYRNRVVGTSIHEASHALIQPSGYRIPAWVNEGIAEYFEEMVFNENKISFNPQYDRHNELKQLLLDDDLISLLEYFGLTNEAWKNRSLVDDRVSRSIAWSLVHFLMSSPDGVGAIKNILKNFETDDETPSMYIVNKSYPGGLNVLEKQWHQYLSGEPTVHIFSRNN